MMKAMRRPARARAGWMMVFTLCGALCAAATAHAQSLRIGTVLGVPVTQLESFRQANRSIGSGFFGDRVPPNDITVLHISAEAGAPINSAIATVSITRSDSGLKAWRVYFPQEADGNISELYRYINAGDSFTNPRVLGSGVVQMDVRQPNTGSFFVEDVRFMLLPIGRVASIDRENPDAALEIVHAQQMTNNFGTFWVQLVAVDAVSAVRLTIPDDLAGPIQALNSNINVGAGNLASDTTLAQVR